MYDQIFFLSHSVEMLEQERKWRLLEQYGAIPSYKKPHWKSLRKKNWKTSGSSRPESSKRYHCSFKNSLLSDM